MQQLWSKIDVSRLWKQPWALPFCVSQFVSVVSSLIYTLWETSSIAVNFIRWVNFLSSARAWQIHCPGRPADNVVKLWTASPWWYWQGISHGEFVACQGSAGEFTVTTDSSACLTDGKRKEKYTCCFKFGSLGDIPWYLVTCCMSCQLRIGMQEVQGVVVVAVGILFCLVVS